MARFDKPDVTVVSAKDQVVIPQSIREKLGMGPKTKLLVYGYGDEVIMRRLEISDVARELEQLHKKFDARIAEYGEVTEKEMDEIVQQHRGKKRGSS